MTGAADAPKQEEESVAAVYDRRSEDDGGHRPPLQADAPAGPSSEEEAALLAEQGALEPALNAQLSTLNPESGPDSVRDLPPMEDLVKRIPAPTRELLEELFRARFVTVKRIPQSALK